MSDEAGDASLAIKPKDGGKEPTLLLTLVSQDGSPSVDFRVKRATKVEKIIGAYADQKKVDKNALRLFYNGIRLKPNASISDYDDIEDGAQIDVVLEQQGGYY